jgi:RNA polymerase sigma-70 factor (ECF subfamily)
MPGAKSTSTTEPDPAVVQVLVENHRMFLRFLEKRVRSREAAEDILQEAFGKALEKAGAVRKGESAVAWFYRLLRNAVVDHYRRKASADRAIEGFARELDDPVEGTETHDEICACVVRLAGTLKPEYAEALQRIELDGATVKDFALAKDISAGNAAVRVYRAREALRKLVVRSCGTCAEHGCLDCHCASKGAVGC